jgi:hypothetical protein
MPTARAVPDAFQEISELFASSPTRNQVLKFRPSKALQRRARALLNKQERSNLTEDEQTELNEMLHAETFMRLVKAKLRARAASDS